MDPFFDNYEEAKSLLKAVAKEGQRFENNEYESREALLKQARSLVAALETPLESNLTLILGEPTRYLVSRLAVDLKIFETLAIDSDQPKSVAQLAGPCNASPVLVKRLVRHLSASGMISQVGDEEYIQNRTSKQLADQRWQDGIWYFYDSTLRAYSYMPQYFEKTAWQNPENTKDGPFQFAHQSSSYWQWLEERPQVLQAFQGYLVNLRAYQPDFMDEGFYPVHERLIDGMRLDDSSASAFVDVGGGTGDALAQLKSKVPAWKGRLILQELASVIEIARAEPHSSLMELMVHDYLTEQPVKGARAYYLRYIFHDSSDEQSKVILRQLKNAMTPGYSKILIHDCVVADRDPSWVHTALDIVMMATFAAQERTEKEWRKLLESAGLRVTGIWSKGEGNISIIEAMI